MPRLLRSLALLLPALLLSAAVRGQEAATATSESPQRDAIAPLLWLAGDWQGSGWIQRGPGAHLTFTVHEHAETALGGRLLVVEGIGRATGEGEGEGEVVHHAFGVLSWDGERGDYRFHAYRADEAGVDARASVEGGVITWGFESPNGHVRFRIRRTEADEWHETGEFSPDGAVWQPFLEMTLHRLADSSPAAERDIGSGR